MGMGVRWGRSNRGWVEPRQPHPALALLDAQHSNEISYILNNVVTKM